MSRSFLRRVDIFLAVTSFPLLVIPCKVCRESLFKKGTPASAANRHRGWHGAMSAPVHGCQLRVTLYDPDPLQWAGVNCYMALCADNRTKATAISRTKTIRMAGTLLFRLRRAKRMVGGQPCENPYSATHFKSKARKLLPSGFYCICGICLNESGGSFLPPRDAYYTHGGLRPRGIRSRTRR